VHQSLKFVFVQNSISVVVHSLELPYEERKEFFMLVKLEIKHALQESDKFELVGLVRYLLRVQLISGELLVDRRPLRHRSSGFGVEGPCTVHSSGFTDLPSYSLGKLLLQ
jgi:hypothetical protein